MSLASDTFIFVRVPRTASSTFTHQLRERLPNVFDIGGQHPTAVALRNVTDWENRYTFGFIRNPWDWLVSVYNSGISIGAGIKEIWPGPKEEPEDAPNIHPGQRMNMAFPEWVRARITTPMDWLSDQGEVIVDKVYRFEDFISADKFYLGPLGIIEGARVKLSDMPHAPYRDWYDDDLAQYVADKCRREIEIGGYSF